MQIKIMKRKATSQLLADVPSNIEKYTKETGWIDDYMISKGIEYFSSPTGIIVADVELKKGGPETDAENAEIIYESLKDVLTPRQASDLRLWVNLAHVEFSEYMSTRWSIDMADEEDEEDEGGGQTKKVIGRIKSRYFFGASNGKAFVRQGIARLYWGAYLTYDAGNDDPYEYTKFFLGKQDVFVAATERTLARNKVFLLASLKVLKAAGDINRPDTRAYFAEVNRACGLTVLDALSPEKAQELCQGCMDYVLSLPKAEKGKEIKAVYVETGVQIKGMVESDGITCIGVKMKTTPKKIAGLRVGQRFKINGKTVKITDIAN